MEASTHIDSHIGKNEMFDKLASFSYRPNSGRRRTNLIQVAYVCMKVGYAADCGSKRIPE